MKRGTDEYRAYNREQVRRWRLVNPERARANRVRSQSTPEYLAKRHLYNVRYAQEKKALKNRLWRAWAARNPEKIQARNAQRGVRRRGAFAEHSYEQWLALCAAQGGACFYCGRVDRLTRDHRIPICRGGMDTIENLVAACRSCNSRKRHRTVDEFYVYVLEAA